jgi:uncharacterized membrane protein
MHQSTLRRYAAAALLATLLVFALPSTAFAAAGNPVSVPEDSTGTLWVISAWWVTFIVASLVPIATALITRINDSSALKYGLTVVLNGVSALLTTELAEDGAKVLSGQTVMTWVAGIVLSLVAYQGWKTVGATSSTYKPRGQDAAVPGYFATRGLRK